MDLLFNNQLKVGDKIVCHKPVFVIVNPLETSYVVTTANKTYEIVKLDFDNFYIINDIDMKHPFKIDKYNNWFYTLKEYRKLKLDKILSCE